MGRSWFERDDPLIDATHAPAILLDLARDQGLAAQRLLGGTRLEPDAFESAGTRLSAAQWLQLVEQADQALPGHDLAFLFGHRLFPGNQSEVATAWVNAGSLRQALAVLQQAEILASPMLAPRLRTTDAGVEVQWEDRIGCGHARRFMLEAWCTALTSLVNWLSDRRLDWSYRFRHRRPAYVEQYEVHLGSRLEFDAGCDAMTIGQDMLDQAWPRHNESGHRQAMQMLAARLRAQPHRDGFLEMLAAELKRQIRRPPTLEQMAAHLHMSPATLKRKLRLHQSSYQRLVDAVRRDACERLIRDRGFSNEQAATYLNFTDLTNFRRSFKRWTGMTPSEFRRGFTADTPGG
ncbi:AraC family transcriptional regulator ligand-binding domain-containing protein [uncultured Abyssibacter sp.]|uniref:AraC family transcriptional regulator n=1 Tax=uncultured Abyssibacter sp. TaxID=2320202 RepID=UPI0032B16F18